MGYILMLSGTALLIKHADIMTLMIGVTVLLIGFYMEYGPDLYKKKSPATDQSKQDNSKKLHRDCTTEKEEIQ